MHALNRVSQETKDNRYRRWAVELAVTAYKAFTYEATPRGSRRMVWKMSIDLRRPLVNSMGQHDPLDGMITYLELQTSEQFSVQREIYLTDAIADMKKMAEQVTWTSQDPLGIGGLLDAAVRLAQMMSGRNVEYRDLLDRILRDARSSLESIDLESLLKSPADRRIAFREFGLSIGLRGLDWIATLVAIDHELTTLVRSLLPYQSWANTRPTLSGRNHRLAKA